jgi:gamma-glutamylcyclotransferase (GGCT)/AIG2-like uncharacterized protein YtfP
MSTHPYFAYGSNLNLKGMASRCSDSEQVGRATLDGWALTFRGVADIERRAGARTFGALWLISESDLESLDAYEGYPGLYRREVVRVQSAFGEVAALTYVMNKDYVGLPSSGYVASIKRGYEQWGLPVLALTTAVAEVRDDLAGQGITGFEPDGPKRLRPRGA